MNLGPLLPVTKEWERRMGYTPPPAPIKPSDAQCAYCGKPLNDCGCGAKEARRIEPKRQRRIPVRPEPKTGTDWQ